METNSSDKLNYIIDYLSNNMNETDKVQFEQALEKNHELNLDYLKVKKFWNQTEARYSSFKQLKYWNQFIDKRDNRTRKHFFNNSALVWLAAASIIIMFVLIANWYTNTSQSVSLSSQSYYLADTLPDGSIINLWPKSSVSYHKVLSNKNLIIINLDGEAFFSINKNTDKKYTIMAGKTQIKVTGTTFRVKALGELGNVIVSVESGQVTLINPEISNEVIIGAGEEVVYNRISRQLQKHAKMADIYLIYQPAKIN